jgi:hypothetical protein
MDATPTLDATDWLPIDLPAYGAGLRVPRGWETLPPVPSNGAELIRVTSGAALQLIVFKLRRAGAGPVADIAARTRTRLEERGYVDFAQTALPFAGGTGARLDFRAADADRTSREYFAVRGPAVFVLAVAGVGTDEDAALADAVAATFHLG